MSLIFLVFFLPGPMFVFTTTFPSASPKLSVVPEGQHGRIRVRQADRDLSARLVSVSNEKYGYGQTIEQYEGQPILELAPELVLAWTDLANATRWRMSQ